MDPLITGGVAFITGSGSGIGQQIAIAFAKRGCSKLFLVDLSEVGLNQTKKMVASENADAQVICHIANVTEESSVKRMVDACVAKFGRIDFACNNAGQAMPNNKTTDVDTKAFDRMFGVNSKGVFLCHKYEIAAMLQQDPLISTDQNVPNGCRGSIVNTASIAGLGVLGGLSAYHASKHSVVSMTRVDARQFADNGVRVNCVCPGFVDTPMFRGSGLSDEYIEAAKSQAPMHRFVAASEVADGVLFLSGSSASAITGVSLPIDAGALLFHIV